MKKQNLFFCLTIDTECDRSPNWSNSDPLSFRGVLEAIPNILSPVFQKYNISPTYLLSHEIIENRDCCQVLKETKNCELGTHLHGDFIKPKSRIGKFAGAMCDEMQYEYDYDTEYSKMYNLTKMFMDNFEYQPLSFRAGRFGIGYNTGKILMDLGYKVDSSVVPHTVWKERNIDNSPDFTELPEQPYFIGENGNLWERGKSNLLEIPITIRKSRRRFLSIKKRPLWLRPWWSKENVLINIINQAYKESISKETPCLLVMMFHNVELIPKASPYPQTEVEVRKYLDSLEKVFIMLDRLNIASKTLSEAYSLFRHE